MNPVLSIIIPVYNAEDYLDQTITSVLNQSIKNIEVFCVDDGSTDHSVGIINKYCDLDPRIVFLSQEHKYAGSARNLGMSHAKGKYIHFLDADDYVLPEGYESILPIALQNDLDCLKFCAETYDLDNKIWVYRLGYNFYQFEKKDFNQIINHDNFDQIFKVNVTPWSGIYKRTFLQKNSILFNNLFCCNDRSFYSEVAIKCKRMMLVKNRVIVHNINVKGSLIKKRAEHFDCQRKSISIIEEKLLSANLKNETFKNALSAEIEDLLYWYERCRSSRQYEKHVDSITRDVLYDFSNRYPFLCEYLSIYDSLKNG